VKPIAGADVWLENEVDRDKPQRLLLLARNHAGYLALCELLSRAWLDNQYRGRAEIRREWLADHQGLIVLSGGRHGDVGQLLEAGREEEAAARAAAWAGRSGDDYWLGLQRGGAAADEASLQAGLRLAARLDIPVVATRPIRFVMPDDF